MSMNVKLTSKERLFLVKLLNKTQWTMPNQKPMGINNQMHVETILYKLKESQRISTLQ